MRTNNGAEVGGRSPNTSNNILAERPRIVPVAGRIGLSDQCLYNLQNGLEAQSG